MESESLVFTVERIVFCNEENGYCVLRGSARDGSRVTVVGSFGRVQNGEEIKAQGVWGYHPSYGAQFQTERFMLLKPATLKGIEKFLGSGMIKGIGPVTAKRLVKQFGLDTLTVIEDHPERLTECEGIGSGKAEVISKGWFLQRSVREVMIFLQGYGVSPVYAAKIHKRYGEKTVQAVTDNPYLLSYEIPGMGFKRADAVAAELGIAGDDIRRVTAGILYILAGTVKNGHLFLPEADLIKHTFKILNISSREVAEKALAQLIQQGRAVAVDYEGCRLCYLKENYVAEKECAAMLIKLVNRRQNMSRESLREIFDKIEDSGLHLSDIQLYAVEQSLTNSILVITGGPGTGKTTTLKTVVAAHRAAGRKVLLASPTGRAAKRLSEVSGWEASTIHRLLEYSHVERGFVHNKDNRLSCDSLIIDEASMVDMNLFYSLISAVPENGTLILVGDADQLPSVGAGSVLNELIRSKIIPVVKLDKVFRQAAASDIIKNAHLINSGKMPHLIVPDGHTDTDCYFVNALETQRLLSLLRNIITVGMPKKFGFHPINDIQVITPMNKGPLGTEGLNKFLQETLNPKKEGDKEFKLLDKVFHVGDKVIQQRNNYESEVFNGDIGIIKDIYTDEEGEDCVKIEFPQGLIIYRAVEMADVNCAYAITIHKSQGSEYPCVVLVASTMHSIMLQRNLIYTGITRARKVLVMLGSPKAVDMAVKNNKISRRNTILARLIQAGNQQEL